MKLPLALESRGITFPVIAVAGLWALCVASLTLISASPSTTCLFKRITGYPCATCGSTRAFVRLAHADIPGALVLNPLTTLLMLGAPIAVLYALVRPHHSARPTSGKPTHSVLIAGLLLLACNWAYLIWQNR